MSPPLDHAPLLEVCVESARAAVIAERGGAHRIELCADLSVGGVTPGEELMRAARAACSLPLMAMIRPRPGDFHYTEEELARMERELGRARRCGMDGVVFGALGPDRTVDDYAVELLSGQAEGLSVTFHRAFDLTPEPLAALDRLVELGVPRVLTSGHAPTASEGVEELCQLIARAGERIVVMPGGHVRAENVAALVRRTAAREVHSSAGGEEAIDEAAVRGLIEALTPGNGRTG